MADMQVSKTCERKLMSVRLRPAALPPQMNTLDRKTLAYVIGLAIGDGNLSNPNGRATRLRITCDTRYLKLLRRIRKAIQNLLPDNKVGIIHRTKTYVDISCYSNRWESWLGWKVGKGSEYRQQVSIPQWIQKDNRFAIHCLRGLVETDGSIYRDRKYLMVNFVTMISNLAKDVLALIAKLGFTAHCYQVKQQNNRTKYTVRVSKNTVRFIKTLNLSKN